MTDLEPFTNARELNLADAELNGPWPALYRCIEAYERLHQRHEELRQKYQADQLRWAQTYKENVRLETENARLQELAVPEIRRRQIKAGIQISSHRFVPGWRGNPAKCDHNGCSWPIENHVVDRTTP